MCAVQDHVSAIWEGNHARQDTLRGLYVRIRQLIIFTARTSIGRTMRSIAHVGLAESGSIVTQIPRATPKSEPPQIKIAIGSVLGAC